MAIPALATADKSFICSYVIGSDIDHRKALGIINEITTFTNEYIDGFCWIPVCSTEETNDHSWYYDIPAKDQVYVKVGVRVSADGYLHAWLTSSQKISELILWNNRYNTTNNPITNTTVLHWAIEKMYRLAVGNITNFVAEDIKFQKYGFTGATRLYMFGNYSNSLLNTVSYTIDHPTNVQKSSVTWYPNNSTTVLGDILYSSSLGSSHQECDRVTIGATLYDTAITKAFLDDGGSFTDYTSEFNNNFVNDCPLMPVVEELNDAFYFGYSYKFYELKLNIGTAGVGAGNLVDWEYYGGSGWTQFFPTDDTNEFTTSGTNTVVSNMNDDDLDDWIKTTINGSSQYWIRARSNGTGYTTQPLLTQGWVRIPDYWVDFSSVFSKESGYEPQFWKEVKEVPYSESIISICHPSDPPVPLFKNWVKCHIPLGFSGLGVGNNSARNYTMAEYGTITACDGEGYSSCSSASEKWMRMNCEPNRASTFVPAHCSNPAYGNQTDCENAGHTWYDDDYICDSSFTYDTYVAYTVDEWQTITPSEIDYSTGKAKFPGYLIGQEFLCVSYEVTTFSVFDEYFGGDLDELRHHNFVVTDVGSVTDDIFTIFTKHVGIVLLTDADVTRDNTDWTVVWQIPVHSTSDTTNVVTSDDATDQTTVNTLLNEIKGDYNTHRVSTTFHELADNTNVVSSADSTSEATAVTLANEIKADYNAHRSQAGVHYDDDAGNTVTSSDATDLTTAIILANEIKMDYNSHLYTNNGYTYFSDWKAPDGLALRTPGTPNTPYTRPITHHDEFNVVTDQPVLGGFLYEPATSNAFLERDPGTETKIVIPVNHQSDFSFLYALVTSNAFLERDPGTETKIEYPVGNNADFCFLYKFAQPPFSVLYHLKLTGDDLDDGLSWATAWATWTHAMQTTPNERTLLVEEGNYAGEAQVEPDNSIVIFLVKNELDAVSTVVVTIV